MIHYFYWYWCAKLVLVDREALDWEEDSDSEETEKVSEDERDSMDVYDE